MAFELSDVAVVLFGGVAVGVVGGFVVGVLSKL